MILEVKLKLNVNGITKEIAHCGNVDIAAILETLDMQTEEINEGELIDINEVKCLR